MVRKSADERIATMLKDTITLLCKNGIAFKEKFTIEAVIGVTVDDSDVILVSMSELIRAASSSLQQQKITDDEQHSMQLNSKEQRGSPTDDNKPNHDDLELDISVTDSPGVVQSAAQQCDDGSESSADLVFIKQEVMDPGWPDSGGSVQHCGEEIAPSSEQDVNMSSTFDERLQPDSSQQQQQQQQSWSSTNYNPTTSQPLIINTETLIHSRSSSGHRNNRTVQQQQQQKDQRQRQSQQVSYCFLKSFMEIFPFFYQMQTLMQSV